MTEQAPPRMVMCAKLKRELPGLNRPPRNDELGERIFEHISQAAWGMWQDQQTILINHYGLNLADPAAHEFLSQQMEEFLFNDDEEPPEGWIPPGEDPPPGGPPVKGGGKGSTKGAPAPARK